MKSNYFLELASVGFIIKNADALQGTKFIVA
jgi:hypothetical protein